MIFDQNRIQELQELGGDQFPIEMWRLFLEMCVVDIPRLEAALASGKADDVVSVAHLLRSASGNVGAHALHEVCTQIEIHARTQKKDFGDFTAQLESAYAATLTCEPALKAD